jgi:hypothetical protein
LNHLHIFMENTTPIEIHIKVLFPHKQ